MRRSHALLALCSFLVGCALGVPVAQAGGIEPLFRTQALAFFASLAGSSVDGQVLTTDGAGGVAFEAGGGGGGFANPAVVDLDMNDNDISDARSLTITNADTTRNLNFDPVGGQVVFGRTISFFLARNFTVVSGSVGSPQGISETSNGSSFDNNGATSKAACELPPADYGLHYMFRVVDADGLRIVATTGDDIRISDTTSATAGYVESVRIGSTLYLCALDETTWLAQEVTGTWRFDSATSAGFAYTPSAWTSFTPTGTWDNTTYFGRHQQVGNRLHVYYYLTLTGTPTSAAQFYVDMPSGFTVDEAALNTAYNARVGDGLYVDEIVSGQFAALGMHFLSSSDNKLYPYTSAVPAVALTKSAPATFGSDYRLQFNVTIPVQ